MQVVRKPWGKEVWLELNDRYCYKRIYLNAGERTSFQYHEKKQETNYIISGEAEVWLEDENGEIQKTKMGPDDFFTVEPPRKHRVVALTDLVLQEVSTPEVDDVIRIQDDSGRPDGKIEHEHVLPALCIIAAGKGTRMEHLTEHTHKGLLPVEDKAVISHIIDKTPEDYDIVVAIGHHGHLIKEYCESVYHHRNFIWVEVDKIEGEGTGPGYSISRCKEHLQRPFYFITADCIIRDELPPLNSNWLGVFPTGIPELYSTVAFDHNKQVVGFSNKSKKGHDHAFIGLAGIVDYEKFWNELGDHPEVVKAFYNYGQYQEGFEARHLDWIDVGTIDGYLKIRNNKYSLPKTTGETIYRIEDRCVRLFPNGTAMDRLERASQLNGVVPTGISAGEHVLIYDWFPGNTLYEIDDFELYSLFLDWCDLNLWEPSEEANKESAQKFYVEKTISRVQKYVKMNAQSCEKVEGQHVCGFIHEPCVINGVERKLISTYLEQIDWKNLYDCSWTSRYHGDLQFDNVVFDDKTFCLIDWRHDFGGQKTVGDAYYDIAKLYGGVLMNYRLMRNPKNIHFNMNGNEVDFFYKHTEALTRLLPRIEQWIEDGGCDLNKVKLLTGLIWLNMSPLHEAPFSDMLFYKSKEMLGNVLD